MPELKHNFLKGRMNKDLDERLVPNGEYRDALNIEISTSEDSNTGAVQNAKGNVKVTDLDYDGNSFMSESFSQNAITVGSHAEESIDSVFNFVHLASDFEEKLVSDVGYGDAIHVGVRSDAITRFDIDKSRESGTTTPIVVDVFEVRHQAKGDQPTVGEISAGNFDTEIFTTLAGTPIYGPKGIRKGMRVEIYNPQNGISAYAAGDEVIITDIHYDPDPALVKLFTTIPINNVTWTLLQHSNFNYVWRYSSKRVLNFLNGSTETELNTEGTPSSKTPFNNIITGINYIDNILFYTDNRNEPKKINLNYFNSKTTLLTGTVDASVQKHSLVTPIGSGPVQLEEQHITTIRKAPRLAPKVKETRTGGTDTFANALLDGYDPFPLYFPFNPAVPATSGQITIASADSSNFFEISTINDNGDAVYPQWEDGAEIILTGQTTGTIAVGQVFAATPTAYSLPNTNVNEWNLYITDIDVGYFPLDSNGEQQTEIDYTLAPPAETWFVQLKTKNILEEDAFIFFSYRYVYDNGEKSSLAPYSQAVFLPRTYSYNNTTGLNNGMVSSIEEITIYDFVEQSTPDQVESIELVYKSSASENPVIFRNIKKNESEFISTFGGENSGRITVDSSIFGTTLPTKQQIRPFDAVPRKALAQEISSSRVLYGNYVENYDLKDYANGEITPKHTSSFTSIPGGVAESVGIVTAEGANSIHINNNSFPLCGSLHNFPFTTYTRSSNNTTSSGNFLQTNFLHSACPIRANAQSTDPVLLDVDSGDFVRVDFNHTQANWSSTEYEYQVPVVPGNATQFYNIDSTIHPQFQIICDEKADKCIVGFRVELVHEKANGDVDILDTDQQEKTDEDNLKTYNILMGVRSLSASNVIASPGDKFYVKIKYNTSVKSRNMSGNRVDEISLAVNPVSGSEATFHVISQEITSPGETLPQSFPGKSVKSDQSYQIGVVYGDYYGRESTVLVDEKNIISIPKSASDGINTLVAEIKNNPPAWADYFKLYIKEIAPKYYNMTLCSAYPADLNDGVTTFGAVSNVWLSFNRSDASKPEVGDELVLKKAHGSNIPVHSDTAKYKILDIVDNATDDGSGNGFSIQGFTLLNATFEDVNGKFFVKIEADTDFDDQIGDVITPGEEVFNGAVFELRKKRAIDLGLFHEASRAYPLRLTDKTCYHYINFGDTVKILESISYNATLGYTGTSIGDFNDLNLAVLDVRGAKTSGISNINNTSLNSNGLVVITLSDTPSIPPNQINGAIVSFIHPIKGFTSAKVVNLVGDLLYVQQHTHYQNNILGGNICLPIGLSWWNVISFRNGVESDTIKDDFNGDPIYKYTINGKNSGFEQSMQNPDYKEVRKANSIIFSELYDKSIGSGFNEFIQDEDIIKKINDEYGSIQKLFTRDGDVVVFCENKVLKVLSSGKDALFNADGNIQTVSSKNVLGQAIPYLGDYGISTNPESFAAEEYRIYFTDAKKGAVCRLSRDGITAISEAGMKDFFNDHLKQAQAVIGSYDGKKNEYNIVIHEIVDPNNSKNVYNVGYKENVKGWTSFKSFIYESAVTISNSYYTFKNGLQYLHHPDTLSFTYCNFYGSNFNSSITDIFNETSSTVKLFKTLSYEGTQSKVVKFTDELVDGVTYNDNEYYNEIARSGWHVESIVTDMQEGDVDEFIEKEGKWYNYIKGIDTTFTNASDATDGNAVGNLDFNEFSVQGIGNLSANATVSSGTINTLGFLYTITLNNVNSQPSWNTVSSSFPQTVSLTNSTIDVTISSNNGYGIAAADFAINASYTLPTSILSITFADSGTPYATSNNVIATINYATFTLTTDTTQIIDIDGTGVLLPIQYTCNFVLNDAVNNGIFSPGITPHQVSFNVDPDNLGITNSSFTLASQTNTEKIYAFSATIPQTFSGRLIDIEVISGTYADIASPIVSLTQGESSNYSFSTSLFSPLLNKVEVDYDSIAINAPQVDDQNEVFINIQTELAILDFANYNNGSFTPFSQVQTGPIPTVIDVHVNSNCGPFSASFTNSTFSPSTDFEILSVTHDPTNAGGSFVTVSFAENTGGDRLGSLTITSDADSSVTDTIQILQLAANAAGQISVEGEWYIMMDNDFGQPSPTWFGDTANQGNGNSPGMVTDFNGIYRIPDIGVSTPQAYFSVNWNAMGFTLPVAITTSSISLIDTDTGLAPTWCNVFLTSPQQLGSATLLLEVDPNATGVIRTAHLTVSHPEDPFIVPIGDPFVIEQASSYNSSTNTLVFREQGPNAATADDYPIPTNATITFDHTQGIKEFFVQIPASDSLSANGVGYHGTQGTNGQYNNIMCQFNYDNWNEDVNGNGQSTIQFGGSNGWNYQNPEFTRFIPTYTSAQSGPPPVPVSYSNLVNYKVTVYAEENNATFFATFPGQNLWMYSFPVDRSFTVTGFNPHNPQYPGNATGPGGTTQSVNPNDTITVTQLARPRAQFTLSSSTIVLSGLGGDISNLIQLAANGSTPALFATFFNTLSDANNHVNSVSDTWLTTGSTPLPNIDITFITNSSYQYEISNTSVLEPNFTLQSRYIALSLFHSSVQLQLPHLASPGLADETNDYVVLEQASETPYVYFDDGILTQAILQDNVIDNTQPAVTGPSGQIICNNILLTTSVAAGAWTASGSDFVMSIPMIYGPTGSADGVIEFISASTQYQIDTPTSSFPSFFNATDLAACNLSASTGILNIQINQTPVTSVFLLNLRIKHGSNANVFSILSLVIG